MGRMRKPTQMEAFDAMYRIAAADGHPKGTLSGPSGPRARGEALFGDSVELARTAYERTLIGSGYPSAYLEFPLLGEPCFDILSVHGGVEPGASFAPGVDFQFDIMADGTLGDTFGLSLSFNETKPRQARACMEGGYGARICETLARWGLADDRWRLIADAAFARHVAFEREDGGEGRFALCVLFNYAKVKFTACEPRPAKFYLILQARELEC